MKKFVDVETPYSGESEDVVRKNLLYTRACVRDCLNRGETPFASHLLFTQPGILDDNVSHERAIGINAGKDLIESLPGVVTVVYQDLGISDGMRYGIERAVENCRCVEYRNLEVGWEEKALKFSESHSHASLWGVRNKNPRQSTKYKDKKVWN